MPIEWTSAKCKNCGWEADRMMKAKAEKRVCPYCSEKGLVPR